MNYHTVIDTVKVQVDFDTALKQQEALNDLIQTLTKTGTFYIQYKNEVFQRDYFIYSHQTIIATITTGAYIGRNYLIAGYLQKYYISVKFAGLCRYNEKIDSISHYCLLKICAFFNDNNIAFKLTELDVCIDAECQFDNILALCVKKSPKTDYYGLSESQAYADTTYIEKIPLKRIDKAVLRSYVYNKSHKEHLIQQITRFELKLQPRYFHKYGFEIEPIEKALNRYYVMYCNDGYEKNRLIEAYEKYQSFYKREILKLDVDAYRLYPNITKIKAFINQLLTIDDFEVLLTYELSK